MPSIWRDGGLVGKQLESTESASEWLKRSFDIFLSAFTIISLSPIMIIIATLMKILGNGPIFYAHERIGRHGRKFNCLKFRTMRVDGDRIFKNFLADNPAAEREWAATRKLKDDPRVFPFGRVLRKTSLDELPQLFNILKGEMSVVGPRPVTEPELDRYGSARAEYLSVRPGLTGLWQISGRNDVSYDERVSLDCWYIRNRSMLLDLKIIAITARIVFFQKGSY